MDQSLHLRAVFGFYRNTVPVAPHGDDRVLQISPQGTVYKTVQCSVDPVIDTAHAPPDMFQRAAGIVADLIF